MNAKIVTRTRPSPTRLALALAAGLSSLIASPSGWGGVIVDGPFWFDGGSVPLSANADRPTNTLTVGVGAPGSLVVNDSPGPTTLNLARLNLGGRASGYASLSDYSTLSMHGIGGRLEVGHNAAVGYLEVINHAVLDGRANVAACRLSIYGCYNAIGSSAGSDGTLLVASGGRASFAGNLVVGNVHVDTPVNFGDPGASSTGRISVLTGGVLETDTVSLGQDYKSNWALGTEQSIATARVEGSGSTWRVTGSSYDHGGAFFNMAIGDRSTATLDLWHGGRLRIEGPAGRDFGASFGLGGNATVTIRATDFVMTGDAQRGFIHIANGGTSTVNLIEAGNIQGGRDMQIGLNGGNGTVNVVGKVGHVRPFIQMAAGHSVSVGNAGIGQLNISGDGLLSAATLNIGLGAGVGKGTVQLTGPGSVIALNRVDGHRLSVGEWGEGTLVVSRGATLDATANAAACANHWCGGSVGLNAGSTGKFTITDAGSQASFLGDFNIGFVDVSRPPLQSWISGTPGGTTRATVEVLNGGVLNTERVNVGGWLSPSGNGHEQSFSTMVVRGVGSVWNVLGSPLEQDEARIGDASSPNSFTDWTIDHGGRLNIAAQPGRTAGLALGQGGNSQMVVNGSGSRITMSGERIGVGIGADSSFSGSAALTLSNGGALTLDAVGDSWVNIGERGSNGLLRLVTGAQLTGAQRVTVGAGGLGSLRVADGSMLQAGQLDIGRDADSHGSVTITGAGTRVALGDVVNNQRLTVGNGEITVSGGALLSTRANESACAGDVWCATLIGGYAGVNANLTVSGANSKASFTGHFQAGRVELATLEADGWTQGTPGGQTTANIKVLEGGVLQTDHVSLGLGTFSLGATGGESAIVNVLVSGTGSRWEVSGGNNAAYFKTQLWNAKNSQVAININNGGQMLLAGPNFSGASMSLAILPGITTLAIKGTGSALDFTPASLQQGGSNSLYAARSSGAIVDIGVSQGGRISGVNYLSLGDNGGYAALRLDGAGSQYLGAEDWASVRVGRSNGQGSLNVSGGAQMLLHAKAASFMAGFNGGQGTAQLQGAGSLLSLKGVDDGTGTGSAQAYVGYNGGGSLNIKSGAQLRIESVAPAVAEQFWRGAGLTVGLSEGGTVAQGQLGVAGAGSRIDILGVNPFITVGAGTLGSGQLTISDGASVQTTLMGIGDFGATGSVRIDNAKLTLSEAWRSGVSIGASLAVGSGAAGHGLLALSNGARLAITNSGPERTNLSLGGLAFGPGGSGVMTLTGGSSVTVGGAGGGQIVLGRTAGSVGVATISGGSHVSANYVGVGALNGADTGVASLLVQDSSTVIADTLEIGAKGFVGGTGTLVGNIINRGVFSPGNSPGTLVIDGSFSNQAGGRLVLEVQDDGHGGFNTDHLVFSMGSTVDLSGLQVSFRFLGNTNPNAFQASGLFDVDTFFQQRSSTGISSDLSHALFQTVSFSASADAYQVQNFSFSAATGATFTAAAVPEPGEWAMLSVGLGALGLMARRRQRAS